MPDRPLTVHCSGLGGGLLSPDHDYDIFFQNHAQMKVYGPSLAMTDNWEQRITQLGLTKTTHEYAIYQLFSTALFLWPAPLSFDWSPHLRLTCGPAGSRITTGSLSASSTAFLHCPGMECMEGIFAG